MCRNHYRDTLNGFAKIKMLSNLTVPFLNTININSITSKRFGDVPHLFTILRKIKRSFDRARFRAIRCLDPGAFYYTDEADGLEKYHIRKALRWISVCFTLDFFGYLWLYHLARLSSPVAFPLFLKMRQKYRKGLLNVRKFIQKTRQRVGIFRIRTADLFTRLFKLKEKPKSKILFQDLPVEILYRISSYNLDQTTLMSLNSYFLKVFASKAYNNIHGLICITATTEMRYMDKWTFSGNLDGFDSLFDELTYFDATTYWIQSRFKVFERIMKRQNDEPFRVLQLGTRGRLYGLSKERLRHLKDVTLIQNPKKLQDFCSRIVNYPNSILKKFVQNFTVDLLILEDYPSPSCSISYMIRKLRSEFCGHEIKTETDVIQVFTDYYVAAVEAPYPGIDMPFSMRDILDGVPFRKMVLVSKFYEMFLTGERAELSDYSLGWQFSSFLNAHLREFRIDGIGEVPPLLNQKLRIMKKCVKCHGILP